MGIRMVVEEVAAAAKLICTVQLFSNVKTSARNDRLIICTPSDVNTDGDVLILSHIFNPRQ